MSKIYANDLTRFSFFNNKDNITITNMALNLFFVAIPIAGSNQSADMAAGYDIKKVVIPNQIIMKGNNLIAKQTSFTRVSILKFSQTSSTLSSLSIKR